jgi:hypothetical protein
VRLAASDIRRTSEIVMDANGSAADEAHMCGDQQYGAVSDGRHFVRNIVNLAVRWSSISPARCGASSAAWPLPHHCRVAASHRDVPGTRGSRLQVLQIRLIEALERGGDTDGTASGRLTTT